MSGPLEVSKYHENDGSEDGDERTKNIPWFQKYNPFLNSITKQLQNNKFTNYNHGQNILAILGISGENVDFGLLLN